MLGVVVLAACGGGGSSSSWLDGVGPANAELITLEGAPAKLDRAQGMLYVESCELARVATSAGGAYAGLGYICRA